MRPWDKRTRSLAVRNSCAEPNESPTLMVSTTRDGAAVLGEFDDMMTRDQECLYVCVWSGLKSV